MTEGLTERSRRRAALCRRSNATSFGARRSGRHPDNSANFTTIVDGRLDRLDRLGPAREVAQVGAVIGRDFSYALLSSVAGLEDAPMQTVVGTARRGRHSAGAGLAARIRLRFKHALIQDAAYENLLKSRRQILHRRVGEVLRDQFAAGAETEPELLAHHFKQAGLIEAAIEW
jgi:predicted ATPase